MNDELKIAWAAGFLDGEGCFALTRSSGRGCHETTRNAVVHISQVDTAPLYRLAAMFGGQPRELRVTSAGNQAYQWAITGRAVIPVIEAVLPHMTDGVKKIQAQAVLDYARTIGNRGSIPGEFGMHAVAQTIKLRRHMAIARHTSARRGGVN